MTTGEIVTIVLALLASLPGLLALRSQFARDRIADRESKSHAETERINNQKIIMEQAMSLLAPMKAEIKELKAEQQCMAKQIEKQNRQISYLRSGVNKLCGQIKDLGHEPVFLYQEDWDG